MKNYKYVTKREAKPFKKELIEIINKVQDVIKDFTINYRFVGSAKYNLISYEADGNIGYDFDVRFYINNADDFNPNKLNNIIKDAIEKVVIDYDYDAPQRYKSVFVLKVKDKKESKILHSCDIAIMKVCEDGREQILKDNKDNTFKWEFISQDYADLDDKIKVLKQRKRWQTVRDEYIDRKCNDDTKKSIRVLVEVVNELYEQYK